VSFFLRLNMAGISCGQPSPIYRRPATLAGAAVYSMIPKSGTGLRKKIMLHQ
jgi:hypothetical protein